MAQFIFTDNANTTLATGIGSSTTTIVLAPGTGNEFPSPAAGQQFAMTLNDAATKLVFEVVYVTARSGDTCTVVRGQEGTTAVSWAIGDYIFHGPTAGTQAAFGQTAAANTWSGANAFTQPVVGAQVTAYNELLRADQSTDWNIRTISSNYSVVATDAGQLLNIYNSSAPTANYTISLPAPSTMTLAKVSFVIAQLVTTFTTASGIIWGWPFNLATINVPNGTVLTLQSDGTNWVITRYDPGIYRWDAGSGPASDVTLFPTNKAIIHFNSVASFQFGIAVVGAFYKVRIICTANTSNNADIFLQPNNSNYSSAFILSQTYASDETLAALGNATTQAGFVSYTVSPYVGNVPITNRSIGNNFGIDLFYGPNGSDNINDRGPFFVDLLVSASTGAKMVQSAFSVAGGAGIGYHYWQDTVTPWTSLGTFFINGGLMTGYAIVERLEL